MTEDNDKAIMELRDEWYARAADKAMTLETLPAFLKELAEHEHDYSTICYALTAGAVATAWALNRTPNGGITGFQAGAIMWEFMDAWNGVKAPARLLKFEDALFPQYADKFTSISSATWKWLQDEAGKRLEAKEDMVASSVIAHWKSIRDGQVPFGLKVRD